MNKQKFNERLRLLRKEAGLSQQEFAKQIGMSKSSVNMYERGEREPGFETLECIADYFNVDMNYLLGKSEIRNALTTDKKNKTVAFPDKLKELRKQKHITQQSLAKALGISASAIGMYEQGRREPDFETLEMIADFFNVNMGYLLDSNNNTAQKIPTPTGERGPDVHGAKLALFGGDGEVTDEMWEEALFAAQIIKERYRRKKENDE